MKKTILVSLAGLVLILASCTQQTPTINQNSNQVDTNANSSPNNQASIDNNSYLDWQLSAKYPGAVYPPDWNKKQYFDACSNNINLPGGTDSLKKADADLTGKFLESLPKYSPGYINEACLDATSKKIFYSIAVENTKDASRLAVYDGKTYNIIDSLKLNIGGNAGCNLVGYSQKNDLLFYDCGWGDGPVSNSTLYSVNLGNNNVKAYERCDTGPDKNDRVTTTCSVIR
jgi:hypothetical protein